MQKTFEILKVHRQDVLKETMKNFTFPLHPVTIYGQDQEKQKRCGTSYQSFFGLQNMFRYIHFWSDPLNLKSVERKGKTSKIFNISMKRTFERQDN